MVGFEYDNCCWQMRLLYMRYIDTAGGFIPDFSTDLDRENAVQSQFALKGMGGFGSRVENLMRDMIRGFDQRTPVLIDTGLPPRPARSSLNQTR